MAQEGLRWKYEYEDPPFLVSLIFGFFHPKVRKHVLVTLFFDLVILGVFLTWDFGPACVFGIGLAYAVAYLFMSDFQPKYAETGYLVSLVTAGFLAAEVSESLIGIWWVPFGLCALVFVASVFSFGVVFICVKPFVWSSYIWRWKIYLPYRWWSNAPYEKRQKKMRYQLVSRIFPLEPSEDWHMYHPNE